MQALLNNMQFMYASIDSSNFVISAFLDFKNAFDVVFLSRPPFFPPPTFLSVKVGGVVVVVGGCGGTDSSI